MFLNYFSKYVFETSVSNAYQNIIVFRRIICKWFQQKGQTQYTKIKTKIINFQVLNDHWQRRRRNFLQLRKPTTQLASPTVLGLQAFDTFGCYVIEVEFQPILLVDIGQVLAIKQHNVVSKTGWLPSDIERLAYTCSLLNWDMQDSTHGADK